MITNEQQAVARALMEHAGYEDIEFRENGDVVAIKDDESVLVINTNDIEFELDYGRYVVERSDGYYSTCFLDPDAAKREAAFLSESTGTDHRVIDLVDRLAVTKQSTSITVFTKPQCPACEATKKALYRTGLNYEVVDVENNPELQQFLRKFEFHSMPVVEVFDGEDYHYWNGFRPDLIKRL